MQKKIGGNWHRWFRYGIIDAADLLDKVAQINPLLRIRFSTSNPQDMGVEVIDTIKKYNNICNHIHLPVQSGSNSVLKAMNRQHTRMVFKKNSFN